MILKIFNFYIPLRRIAFFFLESLSIILIIWLLIPSQPQSTANIIYQIVFISILIQFLLYNFEMYEVNIFKNVMVMAKRLFFASAASLAILFVLLSPISDFGLDVLVTVIAVAGFTGAIWRILYSNFAGSAMGQKLLIVGSGTLAKNIASEVIGREDSGFHVLGFVCAEPGRIGEKLVNPCIVGDYSNLHKLVGSMKIDRVIVALEDRRGKLPTSTLLDCKMKGITVQDGFDFFERLTGKLSIESLRPSALIFADGFRRPRWKEHASRGLSVILAFGGLLFFAPVALITAAAIKIDSTGPIIYRQERVGEGGRPFTLFKFRSMRVDAEQGGPAWASNDDPRVTRVGKFIRKCRLDEIPQLWNVLRNDMALVGPRPERQYFVDILKREIPYYGQRFAVKPGITGWAQICYSYGASKEESLEKLKYDLFYIKHRSISFDLYIIFQTVKIVLFGKGAR